MEESTGLLNVTRYSTLADGDTIVLGSCRSIEYTWRGAPRSGPALVSYVSFRKYDSGGVQLIVTMGTSMFDAMSLHELQPVRAGIRRVHLD